MPKHLVDTGDFILSLKEYLVIVQPEKNAMLQK